MASIARSQFLRQAVAANGAPMCITRSPITSSVLKSSFVKDALPGTMRVAAFHASARRDILPPLPQVLTGTANEAAAVPPPHPSHGNYHWVFERAVSALLVPVTIAPFVGGSMSPVLDAGLCALLVAHSHMGFQACITDYFPRQRVPKTRKTLEWVLLLSSGLVSYGLWEFETNDVGLTEGIKRIWKAGANAA